MDKTIDKIKLKNDPSICDLQEVCQLIYGLPNDQFFDTWDLASNQERFMMRAIKGIRKGDLKKIKTNLVIAASWFISLVNRFHIDLEEAVWNRFPYQCSYCGSCPCACKKIKPTERPIIYKKGEQRPKTLRGFQFMFEKIYPSGTRTLEQAGIHLAEEDGEMSEAIQAFFGSHSEKYLRNIIEESADYFSCILATCNSAKIDFEKEIKKFYSHNCHSCRKAPCACNFRLIVEFKS